MGAGAKIRLHTPKAVAYHEQPHYCRCMIGHSLGRMASRIKKFTPHCVCRPDEQGIRQRIPQGGPVDLKFLQCAFLFQNDFASQLRWSSPRWASPLRCWSRSCHPRSFPSWRCCGFSSYGPKLGTRCVTSQFGSRKENLDLRCVLISDPSTFGFRYRNTSPYAQGCGLS